MGVYQRMAAAYRHPTEPGDAGQWSSRTLPRHRCPDARAELITLGRILTTRSADVLTPSNAPAPPTDRPKPSTAVSNNRRGLANSSGAEDRSGQPGVSRLACRSQTKEVDQPTTVREGQLHEADVGATSATSSSCGSTNS